jgi:hypothetical protein
MGKGCRRVNAIQKKSVHLYINAKMIPTKAIPAMGGRRVKGKQWRG